MDEQKLKKLWILSLLVICCVTITWAACNSAGIDLPDIVVRLMGVLDLCALPVLVYTSVKRK